LAISGGAEVADAFCNSNCWAIGIWPLPLLLTLLIAEPLRRCCSTVPAMPVDVPGRCLSLASADFTIIKGPFSCSEEIGKNDLYKFWIIILLEIQYIFLIKNC
jgi:hypothetical protein